MVVVASYAVTDPPIRVVRRAVPPIRVVRRAVPPIRIGMAKLVFSWSIGMLVCLVLIWVIGLVK